jgi:sucrose-phosphate synthase
MNFNERSFLHLVVSDIDNTLLVDDHISPGQRGDEAALMQLKQELEAKPRILFGVASGRSLTLVQSVMARYPNLPVPEFLIVDVGSQIYWRDGENYISDDDFQSHIRYGWNRTLLSAKLGGLSFLEYQEAEKQKPMKLCFYTREGFDLALVQEALEGLPCTILYSHGEFLDILPERASKAQAISFVAKKLGVGVGAIAAAGDSGNDCDMLEAFKGIIVGNHAPELEVLRNCPEVFFASRNDAAGVLEGLRHYGFLPSV